MKFLIVLNIVLLTICILSLTSFLQTRKHTSNFLDLKKSNDRSFQSSKSNIETLKLYNTDILQNTVDTTTAFGDYITTLQMVLDNSELDTENYIKNMISNHMIYISNLTNEMENVEHNISNNIDDLDRTNSHTANIHSYYNETDNTFTYDDKLNIVSNTVDKQKWLKLQEDIVEAKRKLDQVVPLFYIKFNNILNISYNVNEGQNVILSIRIRKSVEFLNKTNIKLMPGNHALFKQTIIPSICPLIVKEGDELSRCDFGMRHYGTLTLYGLQDGKLGNKMFSNTYKRSPFSGRIMGIIQGKIYFTVDSFSDFTTEITYDEKSFEKETQIAYDVTHQCFVWVENNNINYIQESNDGGNSSNIKTAFSLDGIISGSLNEPLTNSNKGKDPPTNPEFISNFFYPIVETETCVYIVKVNTNNLAFYKFGISNVPNFPIFTFTLDDTETIIVGITYATDTKCITVTTTTTNSITAETTTVKMIYLQLDDSGSITRLQKEDVFDNLNTIHGRKENEACVTVDTWTNRAVCLHAPSQKLLIGRVIGTDIVVNAATTINIDSTLGRINLSITYFVSIRTMNGPPDGKYYFSVCHPYQRKSNSFGHTIFSIDVDLKTYTISKTLPNFINGRHTDYEGKPPDTRTRCIPVSKTLTRIIYGNYTRLNSFLFGTQTYDVSILTSDNTLSQFITE